MPLFIKILERVVQNQSCRCKEKYLSSVLRGFKKSYSTQHALGSSIKDVRTNLGISGTPPVQACPHLVDPPSPCPWTQGWHYLKNCNLWTIHAEGWKKLIILILDVHTCVLLLDNFDNSIPKDGVDHEVNVTHRHNWPNRNFYILYWIEAKWKFYIQTYCQIIWVNFINMEAIIFFPSGRPHLATPLPLPLSAFIHFCLNSLPP